MLGACSLRIRRAVDWGAPTMDDLKRSVRLFRSFADPVRLRLLNLLAEGKDVCVHHLHEALQLPQPTVSRHLAYLRRHGVVVGRKEGLWVHYRLARPSSALHRMLLVCLQTCLEDEVEQFHRDHEHLEKILSRTGG